MSTTAYNRKYVYLSPIRAARAHQACLEELVRVRTKRDLWRDNEKADELYEHVLKELTDDVRLMMDIVERLARQGNREGKVKPASTGTINLPSEDSDEPLILTDYSPESVKPWERPQNERSL